MKINFLNSISSKAGAPREFFAPAFLKKKQMFIKSNISFQRMICPIRRAIFNAPARGEYRGRTQTDRRARGAQKSFFESEQFLTQMKGNEAIL